MPKADVTTTVKYEANGTELEVQESDTVPDAPTDSLSGKGDSGGASTDANEPDGEGGSERRERNNPIPEGGTFKSASVSISLLCSTREDGTEVTASLNGSGNVSAEGYVDGNCVVLVTVDESRTDNGGTETKTTTKRDCCD